MCRDLTPKAYASLLLWQGTRGRLISWGQSPISFSSACAGKVIVQNWDLTPRSHVSGSDPKGSRVQDLPCSNQPMRGGSGGALVERQHRIAAQRLHLGPEQVVGPIATVLLPGFKGAHDGRHGLKT